MCRHVRVCVCACALVCASVYRPEVKDGCLSQFSFRLIIWDRIFFTIPGTDWLDWLAIQPRGIPTPVRLRHWDYRCVPLCPALLWVLRIKPKRSHLTDKHFAYRPISPVLWHLSLRTNTYSASLCQTPAELQTHINKPRKPGSFREGFVPLWITSSVLFVSVAWQTVQNLGSAQVLVALRSHAEGCSSLAPVPLVLQERSFYILTARAKERTLFPFSPIHLCRSSALPLSS